MHVDNRPIWEKSFANFPKFADFIKNIKIHFDFVTLMVDTSNIPPNSPNLKQEEIDKCCRFVHLNNQGGELNPIWIEEGGNNEEYEIEVNPLDMVVWNGIPKGKTMEWEPGQKSNYSVRITEIDYEKGENLFGSKDLKPISSKYPYVQGIVRKDVSKTDHMSYIIKFEVYNGKKLHGAYQIDPKISIKPTQGGRK